MTNVIKIEKDGKKAEVVDRYLADFIKDGWLEVGIKTDDSINISEIELKINSTESKDDIEAIIKDAYNIDIDKRGNLDTVKEKAISIVRAHGQE